MVVIKDKQLDLFGERFSIPLDVDDYADAKGRQSKKEIRKGNPDKFFNFYMKEVNHAAFWK